MDGAIKKLFNGEKLTRNDYIAIKNSYSDHVAEFNPATPLACRKCLDVEKRFRYKVIESIRSYVKSQRLAADSFHGLEFINLYLNTWERFKSAMTSLSRHLWMLENFKTCPFHKKLHHTYLGFQVWVDEFLNIFKHRLFAFAIDEAKSDRQNEDPALENTTRIVNSMRELDNILEINLTANFLKRIRLRLVNENLRFYMQESERQLNKLNLTEYLNWAKKMIEYETKVGCKLSPVQSNRNHLRNIATECLIRRHVERLAGEIMDRLKSNRMEGTQLLRYFLSTFPSSREEAEKTFQKFVVEYCSAQCENDFENARSSPEFYVEAISTLKNLCKSLIKEILRKKSDAFYESAVEELLKYLIIKDGVSEKSMEFLVKYIDSLISERSLKEEFFDANLNVMKEVCYSLIKDYAFRRIYKEYWFRRLLKNFQNADKFDVSLVQYMEEKKCDNIYLSEFKKMCAEAENARKFNREFNQFIEQSSEIGDKAADISCSFLVLKRSEWPINLSEEDMKLPSSIEKAMNAFEFYFLNKTYKCKYRKLSWCHQNCSAELCSTLNNKNYTFHVSAPQMNILLLFNDADVYTVAEIEEKTKMDRKVLIPTLELLLNSKVLKIIDGIQEKGEGGESNDKSDDVEFTALSSISLDSQYYNDQDFVDLNQPVRPMKEKMEIKKREKQRIISFADKLKCHIVNIMKAKKTLNYKNLLEELEQKLSPNDLPDTQQFKICVEWLLENAFIRRNPKDLSTLEYVP